MCGIAGIFASSLSADELRTALTRMADAMVHRGPDQGALEELLTVVVAPPVVAALVFVTIPVAPVAIPAVATLVVPVVVILADLAPDFAPRLAPLARNLPVAFADLAPGALARLALAKFAGCLLLLAAHFLLALAHLLANLPAARGRLHRSSQARDR